MEGTQFVSACLNYVEKSLFSCYLGQPHQTTSLAKVTLKVISNYYLLMLFRFLFCLFSKFGLCLCSYNLCSVSNLLFPKPSGQSVNPLPTMWRISFLIKIILLISAKIFKIWKNLFPPFEIMFIAALAKVVKAQHFYWEPVKHLVSREWNTFFFFFFKPSQ